MQILRFKNLPLGALLVMAALSLASGCGSSTPASSTKAATNTGPKVSANAADADSDKDGIVDSADECPHLPESKNGIDDDDGCPESDQDQDGFVGSADKCPTEPEDYNGDKTDGCPNVDDDEDGVANAIDQCPTEKENINAFQDADGCPDVIPPPVKKFSGTIAGVAFKAGSALVTRSSQSVLNEAAAVLIKYKTVRIEIQGHTDNKGDRGANIALSQKRADAVRSYLTNKGVEADRLRSVGYGPDKPVADNSTKKGRAQNRRVQFKRLPENE